MKHTDQSSSPDGCWIWTGGKGSGGYGKAWLEGRTIGAHRAMYLTIKGPIADGLTLDHLCRNRLCVNPDHLEPVTIGENTRRGDAPGVAGRHNSVKTNCPAGHPYDEANTYVYKGKRNCRACGREKYRRKRKVA